MPWRAAWHNLRDDSFREIKLLDETYLTVSIRISIATLDIDAESPFAKVNTKIWTALPGRVVDQPTLVNCTSTTCGKQVGFGRKRYHPEINFGTRYVIFVVVICAKGEVQRMA